MKIPYIKAKDKETGIEYQGFYYEYPETTYCISSDYLAKPVKIIPCLITHRAGDWGLPNQPQIVHPIDKDTIKIIGYIDTDNDYYHPLDWIKEE